MTQNEPEAVKLYMIFHGEMLFVDDGTDLLHILVPQVDEHVYLAGPFLGESAVPPKSKLRLWGCATGDASPCDDPHSIALRNLPIKPDAKPLFELSAPKPDRIHSGRSYKVDSSTNFFSNLDPTGAAQHVPTDTLNIHPVFEYRLSNCLPALGLPYLGGLEDDPGQEPARGRRWSAGRGRDGVLSLHLYAEEDRDVDPQHTTNGLQAAGDLIGLKIALNPGATGKNPTCDQVDGLRHEEIFYPLAQRLLNVADLGRQLRESRDENPGLRWPQIDTSERGVKFTDQDKCNGTGGCPPIALRT